MLVIGVVYDDLLLLIFCLFIFGYCKVKILGIDVFR